MNIESLEKMLANGQDNALLRYTLGNEYFKQGDLEAALDHLYKAVELDPSYSVAWKILGKVLQQSQRPDDAIQTYQRGIEIAEAKGDKQAAKEMQVFLKRLLKAKAGD